MKWRSLFLQFWLGIALLTLLVSAILFLFIGWALDNNTRSVVNTGTIWVEADELVDKLAPILDSAAASASCEPALELFLRSLSDRGPLRYASLREALEDGRLAMRIASGTGEGCQYPATLHPSLQALMQSTSQTLAPSSATWVIKSAPGPDTKAMVATRSTSVPGAQTLLLGISQPSFWNAQARFQASIWSWLFPYALGISLLTSNLIAMLLMNNLLRRIRRAEKACAIWAQGHLDTRIQDGGKDEFSNLCQAFNLMAEDIQQLIEAEKALANTEERNRLARELHDTAKQRSFALNLLLTSLTRSASTSPEQAKLIASATELGNQLQHDLGTILDRTLSPPMAMVDINRALHGTLALMLDNSTIQWRLNIDATARKTLDIQHDTTHKLMAIATEGAANILRHSHASHAMFTLKIHNDRVVWTMKDDGVGFDRLAMQETGMGLANINLRAQELPGGRCLIESQPGQGTCIQIEFNLNERKAQ